MMTAERAEVRLQRMQWSLFTNYPRLVALSRFTDFDSRPLDFHHPPRRYFIHPCSQRAPTGGACWRSGGGACGFGL